MSGNPFNRCTPVAIDPRNGDFYVSDGYGNARVHKYSPEGNLLFSWGNREPIPVSSISPITSRHGEALGCGLSSDGEDWRLFTWWSEAPFPSAP